MSATASVSLQQARQLLGLSATLPSTAVPNILETKPGGTIPTTPTPKPQPAGQSSSGPNPTKQSPQTPKFAASASGSKRKSSLVDHEPTTDSASAASKKRRRRSNPPKGQAANRLVPPADSVMPEIESLDINAEVEARLLAQRQKKHKRSRSSARRSFTNGEKSKDVPSVNGNGLTMSNPGKRKRARKSNGSVADDAKSTEKTEGAQTEGGTGTNESRKRRKTKRFRAGQETTVKIDTTSEE